MTHPSHITELPTLGDDRVYARLLRELRAILPPEQVEAVEAILCGPFYDGWATLPPEQAEAVKAVLTEPFYFIDQSACKFIDQSAYKLSPPQSPRRQRKPRNPPPNGLLTRAEAARKLGCSIKTLNGYVASSALGYVQIGHGKKHPRKMFTDGDLNEFIASQTRKDSPCPSTASRARHTGTTTSSGEVVAFSGVRRPRLNVKPKK